MKVQVLDARFVTTAVAPEGYPPGELPEIAFVGRSNVGKSSLINALAQRRKLVRVSNTPGRTRTLNFFDVDASMGTVRRSLRFADLPGYGFARVSKTERASWEGMITTYLTRRAELRGVVGLVDGEVGTTPDDARTVRWLVETGRPVLVVATKLDRIGKAKRKPALHRIAEELAVPADTVLGISATEKFGIEEVWRAMWDAL